MRRWASTWAVRHLSTVGNHGAARQRGRAAARAAAAAAHQHKQDGADEGSTTATRLGFSSSHGSRTYHPEHITTPTSSSSPSAAETMHPMQPLVEPSSEWAYRHRLEQGRMGSLLELVLSPYAPGGLQVLADVLQHIQQRKQMMAMGNGANDASSVSVEGLRGCTLALSSRLELAQVMRRAAHEVREVVEAADVVGDRLSMRELQQKAEEVERLAAQLTAFMSSSTAAPDAWPTGSDDEGALVSTDASSADALREWRLSDAVHAEFLRGLLRIGEELGASTMAADVLEQLIELSSRHALLQERATARGAAPHEDDVDGDDECFSLDTVVASVEAEVEAKVGPTTATDHLSAMGSCVHARNFDLALALYRRLLLHAERGVFVLQPADLSRALTHLAHSCRHAPHFGELQRLLQESEVAAAVPVSEPFYTSLVDALSRAEGYPQRMAMALALYRRLRDANIAPTVSTYAALMACCAAEREPTHAFALFHEARSLCGVAALSPAIYANLMMSYVKAGYGADARRTLDVLVEAGAPLTRTAFHAALAGAVSPREAQEILTMMENTYRIAPTPHTFSFMVHAAAKVPSGVSTALALFDLHERCLGALLEEGAVAGESSAASPQHIAASSTTGAVELDRLLLDRYPLYVRAVEHALMKLRIDPMMDPRLGKYLQPLLRVAQRRMNAFTEMPPQAPTRIPAGEHTCIAVLGADVLANVDELVLPFLEHYSAVVIPYSSLLALQMGSGRRVEGLSAKGNRAALFDPVWMEAGDEHGAMVEHRRRRLVSFLKTYADVVHLMSLEEEMQWARDTRRYGIAATNWFARCAAVAIQLARTDTRQGTKVYANHPTATIVLVSASYHRCGRFVVDLRRELLSPTSLKKDGQQLDGLRSALRRVVFHNPATQPDWVPPTLAMQRRQEQEHEPREDAEAEASPPHYVETLPSTAATRLYREKLLRASTSATMVAKSSPEQTSRQEEEVLDAEMLMDLLGMDDA